MCLSISNLLGFYSFVWKVSFIILLSFTQLTTVCCECMCVCLFICWTTIQFCFWKSLISSRLARAQKHETCFYYCFTLNTPTPLNKSQKSPYKMLALVSVCVCVFGVCVQWKPNNHGYRIEKEQPSTSVRLLFSQQPPGGSLGTTSLTFLFISFCFKFVASSFWEESERDRSSVKESHSTTMAITTFTDVYFFFIQLALKLFLCSNVRQESEAFLSSICLKIIK